VLALRLSRLTALEEGKMKAEAQELAQSETTLLAQLADDRLVYDIMKAETIELKQRHATPRRTEIVAAEDKALREEDLLPNDK